MSFISMGSSTFLPENYIKNPKLYTLHRKVCLVYTSIYTYHSTIHTLHFTWYSMHGRLSTPNLPYKALYVKAVSTRSKQSYSPAIKGSINRFLSTCGSKVLFKRRYFICYITSIDVSTKYEREKYKSATSVCEKILLLG